MLKIPYYSQRVPLGHEREFGFDSRADADYWQQRACGIACLQMVLVGLGVASCDPKEKPLAAMIAEAVTMGAYSKAGWIHAKLAEFAENYGVNGDCCRNRTTKELFNEVESGAVCIASVCVGIDGHAKGGHLVVVTGVESNGEGHRFIVNHPSSCAGMEWESLRICLSRWDSSFSGNYIAFR
jgi:hypothetical protein